MRTEAQPTLFREMPPIAPQTDPLEERRKAMQRAYDAAEERWKEEYTAFILWYLGKHNDGTGEEIRLAFENAGYKSSPNSKRASGAIFVSLKKKGVIKEVGKRKSILYGNDLSLYSLVRNDQ